MVGVQEIISLINDLAPAKLSCEWDNSGVQVGNFKQDIKNILLSLDVNEQILKEALEEECGMIIAHHPLIFNPVKSIHNQTATGNNIIRAIKNDIFIYSAHTNLDMAPSGLNDYLVKLLGVEDVSPLQVEKREEYKKIVTFVPDDYLTKVKEAIFNAGAGFIGNYSHTSFSTAGEGTFKPAADSQPFTGEKEMINRVQEERLETIVPADKINNVLQALLKSHPYEEVAYDVYPLNNRGAVYGLGRIGRLPEKIKLSIYLDRIGNILGTDYLRYVGSPDKEIKKVAICNGAGADLISRAATLGADLYITGDIKYHEAQLAEKLGLMLVEAGHYESEILVIDLLHQYLSERIEEKNMDVSIIKSRIDTNPWRFYINNNR